MSTEVRSRWKSSGFHPSEIYWRAGSTENRPVLANENSVALGQAQNLVYKILLKLVI
jgi:hypothetical protein